MENTIRIKEIKLGKPDAKDEVLYADSLKSFCNKIILPPNFEIKNLIEKEKCYIIGNKGVGKTALLFYINNSLIQEDSSAVCSMILFKSHISRTDRAMMDKIEKICITNMRITNSELDYVRDFTKLWTLVIYKKVIEDNKAGNIFERDTNWDSFENLILRLDNQQTDMLKFVNEIPQDPIYYDTNQESYIGGSTRVKYPSDESNYALVYFHKAIDFADKLFCSLKKKEHKYYICIDELEAYNCDRTIYIRDLTMIRDLIITTKRINSLLKTNNVKNIKVILSVRTEMIRSITRELPGLEYNKDLEGFAERINWSGPKIDFIYHPLSAVWIKRIQETYSEHGETHNSSEIFTAMFPQVIGIENITDFVIDRTWQKPRDIIRLMSCLYKTVDENAYYYDVKDFVKAIPEYSRQSKDELTEELGVIYTNLEIEQIFACLTAFKKHFSKEELIERIKVNVVSSYHELDPNKIIDDLYRIGILGLINFKTENELWGYLGQTAVEDCNWRYIVHRGLWSILELEKEAYEGILYTDIVGKSCICEVKKRIKNYLELSFFYDGKKMKGIIHARNIARNYVDLDGYIGKSISAFVTGYNSRRRMWEFSAISKKVI